jgi:hypothetical protein
MLTQKDTSATLRPDTGMACKVYPNGEAVVYKRRKFALSLTKDDRSRHRREYDEALVWAVFNCPQLWGAEGSPLGLSPLCIFDKQAVTEFESSLPSVAIAPRKGLKGITKKGARTVRNACYLIERDGGRARCVFATCTVPDLPIEQMTALHSNWNKAVEIYRLGIKRALQEQGLSGKSVTVSEIQEKRYEKTEIPVLHIHSVFIGKSAVGRWVVTPDVHDEIWKRALSAAIGENIIDCSVACNLQRVKKSAEQYLGKYMTKGARVVVSIINSGYGEWLPKHWWNCTRSLREQIDRETLCPNHLAGWLYDSATLDSCDIWLFVHDVEVALDDGNKIIIARIGRLKRSFVKYLTEFR